MRLRPRADRARRRHERHPLGRDRGAAHDPGRVVPGEQRDDDHDVEQPGADHHGQPDRQQQVGERHRGLGQPVHDRIDPAAQVAGQQAERDPDHERQRGRRRRHQQRDPRPVEHADQQVTAERVGAEHEQAAVRVVRDAVGQVRALHDADRLAVGGERAGELLVRRVPGEVRGQRAADHRGEHQQHEQAEREDRRPGRGAAGAARSRAGRPGARCRSAPARSPACRRSSAPPPA